MPRLAKNGMRHRRALVLGVLPRFEPPQRPIGPAQQRHVAGGVDGRIRATAVRVDQYASAALQPGRHGQFVVGLEPSAYHDQVGGLRSEEHTSELQSLMRISYAVFCLKKKTYK